MDNEPALPVSVRMTPDERNLVRLAAEQANTTVSDFIRRRAIIAAEMEVLENRRVSIPAADWEKFEAWAKSPAKTVPALEKLATFRPAWQD